MEVKDNLKYRMPFDNELESHITKVLGSPFPFKEKGILEAPIYTVRKPSEYYNDEIMDILKLKASEVFKSGCSLEMPTRVRRRSSLMNQFDPFYSRQQTMKITNNCCNSFNPEEKTEFSTKICGMVYRKDVVNKTILNYHMDNDILISIESPWKVAKSMVPKTLFSENLLPAKIYSQEEFHQALKAQEHILQNEFTKKISEYNNNCAEKEKGLSTELSKIIAVNRSHSAVLSEILTINECMKVNIEKNRIKMHDLHVSSEKIKLEIEASKKDLCVADNAFSDTYKRYEISKGMIKDYQKNEEHLTKEIQNMQLAVSELESRNILLKSRIQELTDKAAEEIDNSKKSAATQRMILEAQLKKCEITISTLENDLEQARSHRDKFGRIYDDLMENFKT